jgi:beta-ketoacyl synthase-like protein
MNAVVVGHAVSNNAGAEQVTRARSLVSDRKVVRLLDSRSAPPFVAGVEAVDSARVQDGDRTGLFTASDELDEPMAAAWTKMLGPDASALSPAEVFQRLMSDRLSPVIWLRSMGSNMLCQAAIARGLRGPSIHFVGDGETAAYALTMAVAALEEEQADVMVVVGFDFPASAHPGDHDGTVAAAIALARADDQSRDLLSFAVESAEAGRGSSAFELLRACVVGVEEARRAGEAKVDLGHGPVVTFATPFAHHGQQPVQG